MGLQEMQSTAFRFQNFSNNLFSKYRRSAISNELSTIIFTLQSRDPKHIHPLLLPVLKEHMVHLQSVYCMKC